MTVDQNYFHTSYRERKLMAQDYQQFDPTYVNMLYSDQQAQTDFPESLLYEATEPIFEHTHPIADDFCLQIVISEAKMSQTVTFEFFDSERNSYAKFTT